MPASPQVRDAVALAAAAIAATMPESGWNAVPSTQTVLSSSYWLPTCPRPDLLYRVYAGTIGDILHDNSRILGENDPAFLEPPAGLSDRNYHAIIDAMLRQVRWGSEQHTSELQSLMRISYAVFCLIKTTIYSQIQNTHRTT